MVSDRLLVLAALALSACGPTISTDHDPPKKPRADTIDAGSPEALRCGGQTFMLGRGPAPNMLILLDTSGSMLDRAGDGNTKWNDMKAAVEALLAMDQQIQFGLMVFPAFGTACGVPQVNVPIAAGAGASIRSLIDRIQLGGGALTPTGASLMAAGGVTELHDSTRPDYVLLATDGLPTCNEQGSMSVSAVQSLASANIKTFVIGFGSGTSADPTLLNQLADAGQTARTGATKYFQVANRTDLQAALEAVGATIVKCSYKLDHAPPDTNQLYVAFDSVLVAQDPVDGWTYANAGQTGPTLTFHGASCDQLRSGSNANVVVQYGCSPIP